MADAWTCPLPLRSYDRVTLGHGGGGQLTSDLVEHLILPAFGSAAGDASVDAAVLDIAGERLAFTTDAHVVSPLFFPGGDIGDLAVNGTVNDLAMAGAQPLAISVSFVIEEGLELRDLDRIARSIGTAARAAGTTVAAGDTKVVEHGHADGIYITTTGVGVVPAGVDLRPARAAAGDQIVLSGPIGRHGIAVLSERDGLEFGTEIQSDTAPLNGLVATMLTAGAELHVLRDLTRGGLAAALCEIAESAALGMSLVESAIDTPPAVAAACKFLGLDPTHVANEGTMIAIVPPAGLDALLAAMHGHPRGTGATVIGEVTSDRAGMVVAQTPLGATRIIDRPLGEQLPRIC